MFKLISVNFQYLWINVIDLLFTFQICLDSKMSKYCVNFLLYNKIRILYHSYINVIGIYKRVFTSKAFYHSRKEATHRMFHSINPIQGITFNKMNQSLPSSSGTLVSIDFSSSDTSGALQVSVALDLFT